MPPAYSASTLALYAQKQYYVIKLHICSSQTNILQNVQSQLTGGVMAQEYPIGELKIKPHEHSRLLLGSFPKDKSPKGFSVRISPESELDSVASSVVALDRQGDMCNIIMNIENYGTKTVKAQVWPI